MVAAQLRATIVMVPCINGIDVLFTCLLAQLVGQSLGNTVHASHSRHNPYLVAHAHFAVFPYVSLKCTLFLSNVELVIHWLVGISKSALEVGLQVILINPVTRLQVGDGMAYGITIFNNVSTCGCICDKHFMSRWSVLIKSDSLSVHLNDISLFHCFKANHH